MMCAMTRNRDQAWSVAMLLACALLGAVIAGQGCGRRSEPAQAPFSLPVHVLADSAGPGRLRVTPPAPSVWVAHVGPSRLPAPGPALPDAAPDTLVPESPPPPLAVDPGLKPPILRHRGVLVLPAGARPGAAVELDVRVDETGAVAEVAWAAGSRDTAWVNAARRCALTMRFFPALREGHPVAVWCRQRFDFGR
jgi:hypothetical protein